MTVYVTPVEREIARLDLLLAAQLGEQADPRVEAIASATAEVEASSPSLTAPSVLSDAPSSTHGEASRSYVSSVLSSLWVPGSGADSLPHGRIDWRHEAESVLPDWLDSSPASDHHCVFCDDVLAETLKPRGWVSTGRRPDALCFVLDLDGVLALEQAGNFCGRYHVLGRDITSRLARDDHWMTSLQLRLKEELVSDVILAIGDDHEAEFVTQYLAARLRHTSVRLSRAPAPTFANVFVWAPERLS